jgi:Zn-dependent protease
LRFDPLVILTLPVVAFSLAVHECAHGMVALWRGDSTARDRGRLTLIPHAHLDWFGSLLLPGMLTLLHAPFLMGWGRPSPVDRAALRDPKNDAVRVALAGPLAHAMLALGFAALVRLLPSAGAWSIARRMALAGVIANCALALFHLIPIPPLDGSWLLMRHLRMRHILMLHQVRVAAFVVLAAFVLSPLTAPLPRAVVHSASAACLAVFGVRAAPEMP